MKLKDAAHLLRLAAVLAAGLLLFVVARSFLVPKTFGQYGHYRGAALQEVRAQAINYAGHETCEACHSDVLDRKSKGKHVHVNCESCHGPLAKHADDPTGVQPVKLNTANLCVRCHEANAAKPKRFPQVVSADHSAGLACNECHQPHSPAIATEGAKK
jgi:ribosomal protein L37AE/L43A